MQNNFEAIIFDLDGTLLDTSEGVLNAIKYTMKIKGHPIPESRVLRSLIGPPIQDSFEKLYNLQGDVLQEYVLIFRDRYKNHELLKAKPYDGIYELLKKLRENGKKIAVATYKREDYAQRLLQYYNFEKYTDIIHGGDYENKLTKKDIIKKCLVELQITNCSKAVMVGDSAYDAKGAMQVGVLFAGVTYGFDFKDLKDIQLYTNIGGASTPMELLRLLI